MTSPPDPPSEPKRNRRLGRKLLRLTFLVGLPIILLPTLLPRKVSAKKLTSTPTASSLGRRGSLVALEKMLQDLVDELRSRLLISSPVRVSLVPENKLVVSVERLKEAGTYTLSLEAGFVDDLSDDELSAVIAHELGHVWIFTHHPFLQTEEQANEIAMQIVSREVLESVYEKVWKRTGTKGTLQYLPVE